MPGLRLAFNLTILSVKKFMKDVAIVAAEVRVGREADVERDKSEFRMDQSLRGLVAECVMTFL